MTENAKPRADTLSSRARPHRSAQEPQRAETVGVVAVSPPEPYSRANPEQDPDEIAKTLSAVPAETL